jgi:hypothetical protein
MSDTAQQRSEQAKDEGHSTAAVASEVAHTAGEQTAAVARQVRDQAGGVLGSAREESRRLMDEGTQELRQQAAAHSSRAAGSLRELSERLVALCEGRSADAGPLPDVARELSAKARGFADGLDEKGVDGAMDEIRRFARRRPTTFLLASAGLGFVAGRVLRAGRDGNGAAAPRAMTANGAFPPATGDRVGTGLGSAATVRT